LRNKSPFLVIDSVCMSELGIVWIYVKHVECVVVVQLVLCL
jgi:hypothetical protein